MCEKCEMQKRKQPKPENKVGVINAALLQDWQAHCMAEILASLDLDQEVLDARRAYALGTVTEEETAIRQAEINAKAAADEEKYAAEHDALWERIYADLGITGMYKGMGYTISRKTGEVWLQDREQAQDPAEFLKQLFK